MVGGGRRRMPAVERTNFPGTLVEGANWLIETIAREVRSRRRVPVAPARESRGPRILRGPRSRG